MSTPERFTPNFLSPQFEVASLGYLSAHARQLPDFLAKLPRPVSVRERAIEAAIAWGVDHPDEWNEALKPLVLERDPIGWESRT